MRTFALDILTGAVMVACIPCWVIALAMVAEVMS